MAADGLRRGRIGTNITLLIEVPGSHGHIAMSGGRPRRTDLDASGRVVDRDWTAGLLRGSLLRARHAPRSQARCHLVASASDIFLGVAIAAGTQKLDVPASTAIAAPMLSHP
jgi:hypothetical protein